MPMLTDRIRALMDLTIVALPIYTRSSSDKVGEKPERNRPGVSRRRQQRDGAQGERGDAFTHFERLRILIVPNRN